MSTHNLPRRFWMSSEFPEGDSGHSPYGNLNAADFLKVYNKEVNPFLREMGFKAGGKKALREDAEFYYSFHCGTTKAGARAAITASVHPKGLPTNYLLEWTPGMEKDFSYYLFGKRMRLPNGNDWFDLGYDEDEARETCVYMREAIGAQLPAYHAAFANFREEVLGYTADCSLEDMFAFCEDKGLTRSDGYIWLARLHILYGSVEEGKRLAQRHLDQTEEWLRADDRILPDMARASIMRVVEGNLR